MYRTLFDLIALGKYLSAHRLFTPLSVIPLDNPATAALRLHADK